MNLNLLVRNNLPKIKNGAYVINLDQYESVETDWVALYVNGKSNAIYFDSFGLEHIPKEIRKFIGNKNIMTNIYRIQAYDSIMSRYFCIDFLLNGKRLLNYTNLFSPNDY